MRIRENESRSRLYEHAKEATDQKTKAKAIDTACRHALESLGRNPAYQQGTYQRLLEEAEDRRLSGIEIAEILHTQTVPVYYNVDISRGTGIHG